MTNNSNAIEEYKDLSSNMRHYANMRFAQLTIFFALTSGFIYLIFTDGYTLDNLQKYFLKISGAFLTIFFLLMENRAADKWHQGKKRAIELEVILNFKQYIGSPTKRVMSATYAVRAIYIMVCIFWIYILIDHLFPLTLFILPSKNFNFIIWFLIVFICSLFLGIIGTFELYQKRFKKTPSHK